MSSDFQFETAKLGGGRRHLSKAITLTMAAGATVADLTFVLPTDSRISSFRAKNATAISGSPTNINLTVGKTASGAVEYVAATDVKAAGDFALTLATGAIADLQSWPNGQALAVTLTAVGGTNPAGTVVVEVFYAPPNF